MLASYSHDELVCLMNPGATCYPTKATASIARLSNQIDIHGLHTMYVLLCLCRIHSNIPPTISTALPSILTY